MAPHRGELSAEQTEVEKAPCAERANACEGADSSPAAGQEKDSLFLNLCHGRPTAPGYPGAVGFLQYHTLTPPMYTALLSSSLPQTTKSASLPGSMEPTVSAQPISRAGMMVAAATASSAGMPKRMTFCMQV